MKYLKKFFLFEKLNFDVNDINDMLIDLVDNGYTYHVELDWFTGGDSNWMQTFKIIIWKEDINITFTELESIREDINRLIDFMKLYGYGVHSTYPPRLIKNANRASKKPIDKVEILFTTNGRVYA